MSKYILTILAVAVVAMGVLAASAQAAVIPVSSVPAYSSQYGTGFYRASAVLPGDSQNAGKITMTDPTNPATWTITNFSGEGWETQSSPTYPAWVILDLGSAQSLGTIWLWNQYQNANVDCMERATQTFQVYSVTDTAGDGAVEIGGGVQTLPANSLTDITLTSEIGYSFPLSNASSVRYVKVACDTNYGSANGVGLGLIAFTSGGTTPEPGTLALLAAGLAGLLCYAWRKRR